MWAGLLRIDWFIVVSAPVVIGQKDFGFGFVRTTFKRSARVQYKGSKIGFLNPAYHQLK